VFRSVDVYSQYYVIRNTDFQGNQLRSIYGPSSDLYTLKHVKETVHISVKKLREKDVLENRQEQAALCSLNLNSFNCQTNLFIIINITVFNTQFIFIFQLIFVCYFTLF
jgi:hypothetical protein